MTLAADVVHRVWTLGLFLSLGCLVAPAIDHGVARSIRAHGGVMPPRQWVFGLSAASSLLIGLRLGLTWLTPSYLLLAGNLIAISLIDWSQQRIPNLIIKPAFASGVAFLLFAQATGEEGSILLGLLGAGAFAGLLGAIHIVHPEGMGQGDVRLAALLGLYLGFSSTDWYQTGWNLGMALLLASLLGLALAARSLWHSRDSLSRFRTASIPFGPSLSLGTAAVILLLN